MTRDRNGIGIEYLFTPGITVLCAICLLKSTVSILTVLPILGIIINITITRRALQIIPHRVLRLHHTISLGVKPMLLIALCKQFETAFCVFLIMCGFVTHSSTSTHVKHMADVASITDSELSWSITIVMMLAYAVWLWLYRRLKKSRL